MANITFGCTRSFVAFSEEVCALVDNLVLNRVFTRNVLKRLMSEHKDYAYLTAIRRCSIDPDGKSNGEIISEI